MEKRTINIFNSKKKYIAKYQKVYENIEQMNDFELTREKVKVSVSHEKRKSILSMMLVVVALSVTFNIWNFSVNFVKNIINSVNTTTLTDSQYEELVLYVIAFVILLVSFITFLIVIIILRQIYKINEDYHYLLMLNNELESRKNGSNI